MRKINRAFLAASVSLLIYFQNTCAQIDDHAPGITMPVNIRGYVILSSNDIIYGEVKWPWKYVDNHPSEIKFTSESGAVKTFNAAEIKGAGNLSPAGIPGLGDGWDDYVTLPSPKKGIPVFYYRMIPGMVTVYQNRSAAVFQSTKVQEKTRIDGIGFTWTPGEGLSIGPRYRTDFRVIKSTTRYSSYFVVKENGPMGKVEKDSYAASFHSLYGDCPQLGQELNKNPDLMDFKNFLLVAEIYNQLCN
jgi:hypothetical protein